MINAWQVLLVLPCVKWMDSWINHESGFLFHGIHRMNLAVAESPC